MTTKRKIGRLLQYAAVLEIVGLSFNAAQKAEAGDAAWLAYGTNGYQEECMDEGCSHEERRELYANGDYKEECVGEGCSFVEKVELACTWQPWAQSGCGSPGSIVGIMQSHFCQDGRTVLCEDLHGHSFDRTCHICN